MLNASVIDPDLLRPLARSEYDRMVAEGLFTDERLELLRGALVKMSPQGPLHSETVNRLLEQLMGRLSGRARVRPQCPLAVSDDSEPEPDLAVIAPGDYAEQHPITAYLVVEVADTSLGRDREIKAALYAEAGIPEYWVVNLVEKVVEVYRDPGEGRYRSVATVGRGDAIALVRFADVEVAVAEIL